MSEIKEQLKELLINQIIPESEAYLEELHLLLEENKAAKDDMEAIKDMESFLVELENILEAIKENKIDDQQSQEIHSKILKMIEEI